MSFADWTYVHDAGPAAETWESVAPIQGTHSYSVNDATNSSTRFAIGLTAGVSAPCGRIRFMNKQTINGVSAWGAFANVQTSLALASSGYGAVYSAGAGKLYLYKGSLDNMIGAGMSGQVANGNWGGAIQALGDVYAIQLNWQQVPSSGDIILIGSMDGPIADPDTYDFSTLTVIASYTDSTSPYASGVTAGMVGSNGGTAFGGVCRKYYDVVDIYAD